MAGLINTQRVKRGQHSELGRRRGRSAPTGETIYTQIHEDKWLVKKGKIYWNGIGVPTVAKDSSFGR